MHQTEENLLSKRALIYASLIRYAPEATSLRQRILDRLVLNALVGSSAEKPFRVGMVQSGLLFGTCIPPFRTEVIQESLHRLAEEGKVIPTILQKRHAYYIAPTALDELGGIVRSAEHLFDASLVPLLENTEHLLERAAAVDVCRRFMCECFARFGGEMARAVTGAAPAAHIAQTADVDAAFEAATAGKNLGSEALDSLKARCIQFLKSQQPHDVQLKFHLTQGFYFTQLLGLGESQFNPLFTEAFSDTVLYLDTNVLLVGLLAPSTGGELFREMVGAARKIGISLRVTRATINETRRVAADRVATLNKLIDAVPSELIGRAGDQFMSGFLEARECNPDLTPDEFLEPFNHLTDVVQTKWGIEVDEKTEDEMLVANNYGRIERTIQESSLRIRNFEKSATILKHDVAHFALIASERKGNRKTWFLTRDRSLADAAPKLCTDGEHPFCFSLLGFLQSLSPFITSLGPESKFADTFSELLKEQVFPVPHLFSPKELVLLVEMQQDVLSTPKEALLPALDYVKTVVLRGEPYKLENSAKVALGLRSYLACSSDERLHELEDQRLTAEASITEIEQKLAAEKELRRLVEEDVGTRDAEISQLSDEKDALETELQEGMKREARWRLVFATVGMLLGAICWAASDWVFARALVIVPILARIGSEARIGFSVLGLCVFFAPGLYFVRKATWNRTAKISALSILAVAGLAGSRLIGTRVWVAKWTPIVEFIGLVIPLFIESRRQEQPEDS